MPGPWITTPLHAGPIPGNSYTCTIVGLSASTIYEYRAYMVVSGIPYTGATCQAITLPTPVFAPTVTTTAMSLITSTGASTGGNVTADGGLTVSARGVAWATTPSPTISGSHSVNGSGTGAFTSVLTGLIPNTLYYLRAYATNAVGTNYGSQLSFNTLPIPVIVCINRQYTSGSGAGSDSGGFIIINPLLTAGQSVSVNYNVCHKICGAGCGQDQTYLFCNGNQILNMITCSPINAFTQANQNGNVVIHNGDTVCYFNHLSSTGLSGTCVALCLISASGSGGVSATVSAVPSTCKDCIAIP